MRIAPSPVRLGPLQSRAETLPSTRAADDYSNHQLDKNKILSIFKEMDVERVAQIAKEAFEATPSSPQTQTAVAVTTSEQGHGKQVATTRHMVLKSETPSEICKRMQDEVKGLLAMEYDDAEPPLMPYGFGSAWDDDASGCFFPWRYGATNLCSLGLCKDMFMGKTCRDDKCTHAHNWLSYDQLAYLLSQPDARARKTAREFVHDFFPAVVPCLGQH